MMSYIRMTSLLGTEKDMRLASEKLAQRKTMLLLELVQALECYGVPTDFARWLVQGIAKRTHEELRLTIKLLPKTAKAVKQSYQRHREGREICTFDLHLIFGRTEEADVQYDSNHPKDSSDSESSSESDDD